MPGPGCSDPRQAAPNFTDSDKLPAGTGVFYIKEASSPYEGGSAAATASPATAWYSSA